MNVPKWFVSLYGKEVEPGVIELIGRDGRSLNDEYSDAYNEFLWCALILIPMASLFALILPYPLSMISAGPIMMVMVVPAWAIADPIRRFRAEQRSYMLDSPAVVGAMTMSMNRSPSLERALELASRSGDGLLQSSLGVVIWKALTGEVHDLRRSLSEWTAHLDVGNEGLRRSMHLIMAAEEETGNGGRDRLLDRANSIVLEGLRESCERYVVSLNFPVMLVFAFGVLAPVMLFSLIPLMGMDMGPMGEGALDVTSLAMMLLVIVPVFTLLYMRSLMERNPLCRRSEVRSLTENRRVALMIAAVPLAAIAWVATGSAIVSTLSGLSLVLSILFICGGKESKHDEKRFGSFIDGLYRLGNGMLGGHDLDAAFEDSVITESGDFKRWGLEKMHAVRTGRSSLVDLVRDDERFKEWNPALHSSYITVMECALDDHIGAGKVAINLAQCQSDLARTKRRIRESMRSVMDMMNTTSLLFAPLIIGLTSGIMGMLGGDSEWLMVVASVYVVELAMMVNYFTRNLDGWRGPQKGWRAYGTRGAIALAMFLIASLCGQMFLFRLL